MTNKLTSFRTSDEIRDRLAAAAEARGVSVNQEINERIAASFTPSLERTAFNRREVCGLVKLVGTAMSAAGYQAAYSQTLSPEAAQTWFLDPYGFDQAMWAALTVLEACRPPGDRTPPEGFRADRGEFYARILLEWVRTPSDSRGEELRRDLDPATLQNIQASKTGERK